MVPNVVSTFYKKSLLHLPGFEHHTVQPNHCNNYAIPAIVDIAVFVVV